MYVIFRQDLFGGRARVTPVMTSVCPVRAKRLARSLEDRARAGGDRVTEYHVRAYAADEGAWVP